MVFLKRRGDRTVTSVAADDRAQIGKRNENARIADHVVIEKIARAGVELVQIERPGPHWNRKPDVALNIALAWERNKIVSLRLRKT